MLDTDAANAFGALANTARLNVLRCLVRAGPEGMPAGDIAQALGASPSQTSFHLKALSDAELISSHKQSRQVIYAMRFERLAELMQYLLEDCCGVNGC